MAYLKLFLSKTPQPNYVYHYSADNASTPNIVLPIENKRYTIDEIKAIALEQGHDLSNYDFSKFLAVFTTGTTNDTVIDSINLGGITVNYKGVYSSFDSACVRLLKTKKIKGVNIDAANAVVIHLPEVEEWKGDIVCRGDYLKFMYADTLLKTAEGRLEAPNIKSINLLSMAGTAKYGAFNVLDIRNIDTSNLTSGFILNNCRNDCTLIVGNFTNKSLTSLSAGMFSFAHQTDPYREIVMTTAVPPIFKNCAFVDGVAIPEYSSTVDWIAKGRFRKILVPEANYEDYINNIYVGDPVDDVGKTGWSYYGPHGVAYGGKDIIETYDPEIEYVPQKKWLYFSVNWRRE